MYFIKQVIFLQRFLVKELMLKDELTAYDEVELWKNVTFLNAPLLMRLDSAWCSAGSILDHAGVSILDPESDLLDET